MHVGEQKHGSCRTVAEPATTQHLTAVNKGGQTTLGGPGMNNVVRATLCQPAQEKGGIPATDLGE